MSKAFVVRVSSDYETLYGVFVPKRGDVQRWGDISRAVDVMRKNWSEIRNVEGWDGTLCWFESLPLVSCPEDEAAEARRDGCSIELEKNLDQGDWGEIDEDLIDFDHPDSARTEAETIHVDNNSVFWSFYPKHTDTRLETPWLKLNDLREAVGLED